MSQFHFYLGTQRKKKIYPRTEFDKTGVLILTGLSRSVEQKGLVTRELCNEDRRQMYYSLTQQGRELLASVSCREVETPEILRDWLCG